MKTILLTGATGFLGSYLLERLFELNFRVVVLKRSTSNTWRIDRFLDKVVSYDVDICALDEPFQKYTVDVVIHTACHYGRNDDSNVTLAESNLMYGLRLLDLCVKYNVGSFVNTDSFLPRNLNAYSLSKSQFVDWLRLQSEHVKIVNLKLEHMYGPKDDNKKLVPWVLSEMRNNSPLIKFTKGEQLRDFVYIEDVAEAYMIVVKNLKLFCDFTEFEVGTGELVSVRSFLESLRCAYVDMFGECGTKFDFGGVPYRNGELMRVELDNSSLKRYGWTPKWSIDNGLKMIMKGIK